MSRRARWIAAATAMIVTVAAGPEASNPTRTSSRTGSRSNPENRQVTSTAAVHSPPAEVLLVSST